MYIGENGDSEGIFGVGGKLMEILGRVESPNILEEVGFRVR